MKYICRDENGYMYMNIYVYVCVFALQKFKCGINVVYGYDEFGDID